MTFTKLFSSILDSTVWQESKETKIVWITMLAMADRHGEIHASIPGLAVRSGVSIPECQQALKSLQGPDKFSRTKDHDGRRIAEIDGGWTLLNHAKYRALMSIEERREYMRKKQAEHRARVAKNSSKHVNNVNESKTELTHAEAEAEAEANKYFAPPPGFSRPKAPDDPQAPKGAIEGAPESGNANSQAAKAPPSDLFQEVIPRQHPTEQNAPTVNFAQKNDKSKTPRPRNPAFDALAEVSGIDIGSMTKPEASRVATALANITATTNGSSLDVVATEIRRRAEIYRINMPPGSTLTPTALAANWGGCASPRQVAPTAPKKQPWVELKELEKEIETHPGNTQWIGFDREKCTAEIRKDYLAKLKRVNELKTQTP